MNIYLTRKEVRRMRALYWKSLIRAMRAQWRQIPPASVRWASSSLLVLVAAIALTQTVHHWA